MGVDEEGTLARLNAHRREFLEPTFAEYSGRIVKRTGDGILVEFGSAVDATRCAIQTQRGMAQRNADVPPDQRIEIRIGIHVGDIIIEEGDIFGDGVNIAARLEGMAERGGISISDDTFRQVRGKLDVAFDDAGEQQLKNYRAAGQGLSDPTGRDRCQGCGIGSIRQAVHCSPAIPKYE
jgi:adenylate cyclase